MNYTIRQFQDDDYEALAALNNSAIPDELTSADEMRQMDQMRQEKHYLRHLVAAHPRSGQLIAFAKLGHGLIQYNPEVLWLRMAVHPNFRRKGIGSELFRQVERAWRDSGVARVRVEVKETDLPGLAFLKKFGFAEHHRIFESRLDLRRFNPAAFADPQPILKKEGISLTSLGAEIDGQSFLDAYPKVKRLYELTRHTALDIPTPDPPQPLSLEAFFTIFIDSPLVLPDGIQIAAHNGRYVGLSVVSRSQKDHELRQRLTGVHRDYRRRGIALALKLQGLRYAKATGAKLIKTSNDTVNTGMLAINNLLGFEPEPSWINFEKRAD